MDYTKLFSDRVAHLRSSVIRELLEISQRPGVISFAGGLPNPDAFPKEDIIEIVTEILTKNHGRALQYGPTPGLPEFREELARFVRTRDISADAENIRVTVGSQQAIDIVGRVFLNENDVVIVGLPTYLGAINAFYAYGAEMVGVPLDDNGIKVDIVEQVILKLKQDGKKVKFIYTVPTFQNPAGVELSEERRKRLMELAIEHDIIIIEDEPYHSLRFEGKPLKPIKYYDDGEHVIYMETFSKILAPGFRLAYTVAPCDIAKRMGMSKQSMDLCTPSFTQIIAMHYLQNGYMKNHIPKIIAMYRKKRDIMLDSLQKYFPPEGQWTHPKGGMFLWATLPDQINTVDIFKDAIEEKVAYVHGNAFHVDGKGYNSMRLNFTHASDENIAEGIKRLGRVIDSHMH